MTSARALLALSLLSHLFIIACGDDDGGGGDAGSEEATDAGARLDAGVPDASAAVDAGVDTDASPADAGETTTDAGAEGLALDALVPSVLFSDEISTRSPIRSAGSSNRRQASSRSTTRSMPSIGDSRAIRSATSAPSGRYVVAKEPSAPWCTT